MRNFVAAFVVGSDYISATRSAPLHTLAPSFSFISLFFKRARCFKEFEEEIEYSGNKIVPAMFGTNITKRLLFWVQMRKADLGDHPFLE